MTPEGRTDAGVDGASRLECQLGSARQPGPVRGPVLWDGGYFHCDRGPDLMQLHPLYQEVRSSSDGGVWLLEVDATVDAGWVSLDLHVFRRELRHSLKQWLHAYLGRSRLPSSHFPVADDGGMRHMDDAGHFQK